MEKEVSCRVTGSLIKYVESLGFDSQRILEGLTFTREQLTDPLNWVSFDVRETLAQRAAELVNDEKVMFRAGFESVLGGSTFNVKYVMGLLSGPKIFYRNISRYSPFFNRQAKFQSEIVEDTTAVVRITQKPRHSFHACNYAQGLLSAIPTYWGLPPAIVKERECGCKSAGGPAVCVYEVRWEKSKSRISQFKNLVSNNPTRIENNLKELERNYHLLDRKNAELEARNIHLNKVREIAAGIDSVKTVKEVFELVVEQARDIPGICFVAIEKLEEGGQYLTVPYFSRTRNQGIFTAFKSLGLDIDENSEKSLLSQKLKLPVEKMPIVSTVIQDPRVREVERLSQLLEGVWAKWMCDAVQETLKVKKSVLVPLLIENQVWGSMVFFLNEELPLDILEMIGTHCTLAMKNVFTRESLEKRNRELSAINFIAKQTSKSLMIQQLVDQTAVEITRIFNAGSVGIYLMDEASRTLVLSGQHGMPEEIQKQSRNIQMTDTVGRFMSLESPIFSGKMNDYIKEYPQYSHLAPAGEPVWFMFGALFFGGRRSGTIIVVRRNGPEFQDEEKTLLLSITNQLSIAFENTRLHLNLISRIEELEAAQDKLSESEEKMRLTVESVSEGIMVTSLNGRILQANKSAVRIHGYDNDNSFIGNLALSYVYQDDRRRMLENLKKIKESGTFKDAEYTLLRKDGSLFPAECSISIYVNSMDEPEGFVICIRDISQRKQSEALVRESERKYRLITDNTTDLITIYTFRGVYRYASPSHRYLGYEPEELVGKTGLPMVHPDDRDRLYPLLVRYSQMRLEELERLYKQNASEVLEFRFQDKSGAYRYVEATANLIESNQSPGFDILMISRDVTARRQADQELKHLYDQEKKLRFALEEEIKRRAEFFRALVHELKTPLTPIVASSETLMDLTEDKTMKSLAGNAYRGAMRLNERVDELLDISRGEMGMLKVNLERMSMALLIKDVAAYVRPKADHNRQVFLVTVPDNLPQIMGDESRLRQVLINLLDNAMKFTPEGGQITMEAMAAEDTLVVKVRDTGCGIDEDQQARLFQPYNRVEADRQHFSGLGLGLALSKRLVELHSGKIWVTSNKGEGAVFTFTVPTTVQPAAQANVQSVEQLKSQS